MRLENVKYDIDTIFLHFYLASDWPDINYRIDYVVYDKSDARETDSYFEKIDTGHYRVYLQYALGTPIPNEKYILTYISIQDIYGRYTHIDTKFNYYSNEYFKMKHDIGITYKN